MDGVRTDHLGFSSGRVYLHTLDDAEMLDDDLEIYRFRDGIDWPSELGPEPDWLQAEHDEIADILADSRDFAVGCRWTAETAFATAKGRL